MSEIKCGRCGVLFSPTVNTINYYLLGRLCSHCEILLERQRNDEAYDEFYGKEHSND